jgi:hypothetical protein
MAVTVEMHNTGDPALRAEVVSLIEHILSDRPGDWRVSIVGSQAKLGFEDYWTECVRALLHARTHCP